MLLRMRHPVVRTGETPAICLAAPRERTGSDTIRYGDSGGLRDHESQWQKMHTGSDIRVRAGTKGHLPA